MRLSFLSIFPEMLEHALQFGVVGRAIRSGKVQTGFVNPRDFAKDAHQSVDDKPYGGGPGMLMMAPVLAEALASLQNPAADRAIVVPEPMGRLFKQSDAVELSKRQEIVFVCGRYEGIDERFLDRFATHRFSIGDYVLSGGETPALAIAEATVRCIPGVLGDAESIEIDSFSDGLLGPPQYTKPETWDGLPVPAVLRSGNHAEVAEWKRRWALKATRRRRPDLFASAELEKGDADMLCS